MGHFLRISQENEIEKWIIIPPPPSPPLKATLHDVNTSLRNPGNFIKSDREIREISGKFFQAIEWTP